MGGTTDEFRPIKPVGDLWDKQPYNEWGMKAQEWYQMRYELFGFQSNDPILDLFCSTIDSL